MMKVLSRKLVVWLLSLACTVALLAAAALPGAFAAVDGDSCYAEGYESCVDLESEGAVLLKNAEGTLPLAEGTKVTVLGSMSYNYVEGGTGSAGGKDDTNTVMMNDAFVEAGLDVNQAAWDWLAGQCGGARGVGTSDPSGVGDWTSYTAIHEFPRDVYAGGASTILADGYTDYAVVTFARSGSEGASPLMDYDGDGSTLTGTTYLELDQNERDLLAFCKENFTHTIVLINSAAAMELGFLDAEEYNVDACIWMGHPGEAGVVGVGTILTGRTNPSGRLVDTYAYDVTTNPTYYNTDDNRYANAENQTFYQYEEGIYVGYRYFETADSVGYFDSADFTALPFKNGAVSGYEQVVQFPFGYGLSYTAFTEEITASDLKLEPHGINSITVKVTNTGDMAGKNVVQLYLDAPYQTDTEHFGIQGVGLEKAKVVLVGFAKTDLLEPGQAQELTISFATDALASFDNFGQGCYVLEAGNYKFNVQKDAHQWGEAGSENAPSASVSASLSASVIYDDEGPVPGAVYADKRDSDQIVARNAMDDVTAGDGCMLDGYLSRSDIAGGMKAIMAHTSNEAPNEMASAGVEQILALTNTQSGTYTFETYKNGVKTTLSETLYAHGANMMPFAATTPDGKAADAFPDPLWDQVYYVVEGQTTEDGLPVVVDAQPDGAFHKLCVEDMEGVPIDTEAGFAIWEKLTSMTSMAEAIEVQGNAGWQVAAVPSVGKPNQFAIDGPGEPGATRFNGATWFPCAVTIAATWNTDLARAEGLAYGNQCVLFGISVAYAPSMNIHRSPFGGRNFEYFSEDGHISGIIGGNVVAGIQSTGTSVTVKHLALNDGDTNRGGCTTWANEQAIREIYMVPYEISCKDYAANGIMGSMNRIGMSWYHYGMYVTMLRDEWGWSGWLTTDGDGTNGDCYNSAQMMLCNLGSMLNTGAYINNAATEAAYGDATATVFGRYALHENMRYTLYQYCGAKGTDESGNVISGAVGAASAAPVGSTSGLPVGLIVLIVVAVVAAAAVAVAIVTVKRRAKAVDTETSNKK